MTQFVVGQTQAVYKSSALYQESGGKWTATAIDPPLRRVLDAANGGAILEAIPEAGCCGGENQSDEQALLHLHSKTLNIFDALAAYNKPDYDVGIYTQKAKMSPELLPLAWNIV